MGIAIVDLTDAARYALASVAKRTMHACTLQSADANRASLRGVNISMQCGGLWQFIGTTNQMRPLQRHAYLLTDRIVTVLHCVATLSDLINILWILKVEWSANFALHSTLRSIEY